MIHAIESTVRLECRASAAVQKAVDSFLSELTEATAVCCDEEIDPGTFMPIIGSDALREWLTQTVDVTDAAKQTPSINTQLSMAIQIKVLQFLDTAIRLDSTLATLFRGTAASISQTALHVNIPFVIDALHSQELVPGTVYFVAVPEFYDEPPQGDDRVDVVLGATLWEGALLCRPVLTSLESAPALLQNSFHAVLSTKPPIPNYIPKYGLH